MQIAKDCVVKIEYTVKDENGQVIDTSEGRKPLAYLHGNNNLIPGLEAELEGKEEGVKLEATVPPEKAYGEYNDQMIFAVPKDNFQGVDTVEPGMQFQAQLENEMRILTVKSIEGDQVTVDGNHPLAGKELHFDVEVKDVREATDEELEHGHAHQE
ncbi:MAG: peptidylprolyl isomerase [Spirochaetia bacterium]